MWSVVVIFTVIVSVQSGPSVHNPFYCYSEDPTRNWTRLGGTHSPYEEVSGEINANVSTCTPTKFWTVFRHGRRYPVAGEVREFRRVTNEVHSLILDNYNRGRTSLCASDFELLKNWTFPNITDDIVGHLLPAGWTGHYMLAQRYKAAFPTLFPTTYSPKDFFCQSSADHPRQRHTLEAYIDGLLYLNAHEQVQFEEAPMPDVYMRPWASCPAYNNMDVMSEHLAFVEGPEYQEVIVQVSAKLGLHGSHVLRRRDFDELAFYCKYEELMKLNGMVTEPSPFCGIFSVANAQVIEYAHDIEWQDRVGPGLPQYRKLKDNLMCFTLQDMLRFMNSNDENDHKVRIFSGHASHFIYLMPFGVWDDALPLNRHNFAQMTDRLWKSSYNLAMGSNLAVIRFDCADGDNDILFLFNERPLQIPGCDSNGVCKQSVIMQKMERYLNGNCWEIFCRNS